MTDVLVSPSSVVTELCGVSSCCSDWEFVEPQSFSFSKKRAHGCTDTQEEMRYEGSPVITPPFSRRRMTPPTPVQNSYISVMRDHGRHEEEGRGWNARERTIIARTKQFLERSRSVKVQVEVLEALLGPEDVDVDLRRILKEARDEQGAQDLRNLQLERHELLGGGLVQMGQIQKSSMETRFVGLCKRWMVASKLGTASGTDDSRLEPRMKKG